MMGTVFSSWRTTVFGLLSWAIPFAASIPFFSPEGGLIVPQPLFKSLMVVIGSGAGLLLLVWLFRHIRPTLASGLAVGLYWLALNSARVIPDFGGFNWVLDILVLLPLSGDPLGVWFMDIGLRYLTLPLIAVAIGYVAEREKT